MGAHKFVTVHAPGYGRTYVAVYVCDGRELPDEDDEWAVQPEEATRFGKVVRGGGKRDD